MNENKPQDADKPAPPISGEKKETEQPEKGDSDTEDIDFKAELEKAKRQLEQSKHALKDLAYQNRELKRKKGEEKEADEDDDAPNLEEIIEKKSSEMEQRIRKEVSKSTARLYARSLARNPDEAELILYHYENSIRLTGNIEDDIENARLLANRKRFSADIEERDRALRAAKETAGGASGSHKIPREKQIQLTPQEEQLLKIYPNLKAEDIVKARSK